MSKKRARGFFYAAYLIIATLVLLEIAVRIRGYSERYIYDPIYMPFQQSAAIPFVHRPLLENVRARSGTWFSTDSLGLCAATTHESIRRKSAGEFRIALVGNSVGEYDSHPSTLVRTRIAEMIATHLMKHQLGFIAVRPQ